MTFQIFIILKRLSQSFLLNVHSGLKLNLKYTKHNGSILKLKIMNSGPKTKQQIRHTLGLKSEHYAQWVETQC